jgi:8-oxo-dGTP pyrophosphatase MutT (NUDIX family)
VNERAQTRQIGAVPYRKVGGGFEVLLITSRETRRWVIPKGWPMPHLADYNAARQEALEEAGIEGKMGRKSIGSYYYVKRKKSGKLLPVTVVVYAMEVTLLLDEWPEKNERKRHWFAAKEAVGLVQEEGLRAVIEATFT